jgi:hypothetical protein
MSKHPFIDILSIAGIGWQECGSLFLGFEDTLDDLLFFNQEGTDDTATDAVTTAGTTISTVNGLLGLGHIVELTGTEGLDLKRAKRQ